MNTSLSKPRRGLVLGKFMPLHKGHEYLIRFAAQCCEELTVVVDCIEGQPIEPGVRAQWIEQQVPGVRVVALEQYMPQDPAETPEFWSIWGTALRRAMGGCSPDVVVAAMDYGWDLARELGCSFIPLDIERQSVPICATKIRQDPMSNWEFLAEATRGYFMKKVVFMGPESTGKSTCAAHVAQRLATVYVPEYAEGYIRAKGGRFEPSDILPVALAQCRSALALERMVNRVMVCDTDALTTLVWSEYLYGSHPPELEHLARDCRADITFLFDSGTPWVADVHRHVAPDGHLDASRQRFFQLCVHWLKQTGRRYEVVTGSFGQRADYCLQRTNALIRGS